MYRLKYFILSLLITFSLFSAEKMEDVEGYTINFENVAMKELLQFISKVGNLNLIYNESEVNFNITFVSDKPTSLTNIKSALLQILRINNLQMLEEGNNLIIHKNIAVKQIPTVVSRENPIKGETPAIMTRVFDIQRGNPASIAAIITPLLSITSLVEVSIDTRQIIVTDVASSIATVEQLLKSLDVPHTPYDIDSFEAENLNALELILLAKKIMTPLTDNTLLELVEQPDTNTIYVVSTPFLIDKTLSLLEELDKDVSLEPSGNKKLSAANVLIYQLHHKGKETIITTLHKIMKESNKQGLDAKSLNNIIKNATYIKSTDSLIFVGYPDSLALIHGLIKDIDTKDSFLGTEKASFLLFEPKGMKIDEMLKILDEITDNLEESGYPNENLLHVLTHSSPIYDLDSILFIVPSDTKQELLTLLDSILSSYNPNEDNAGISHFLIYNIKKASEEQIRESLSNLESYLKKNDYPNENLIKTISSMKWIKASNSLFFVGSTQSLEELSKLLPTFDVDATQSHGILTQAPPSTEFLVFTPVNTGAEHLKTMVIETAKELKKSDLSDPSFMKCLLSARVLDSSEQLIFTGTAPSLKRLVVLLEKLDLQSHGGANESELFIYYPSTLDFKGLKTVLDGIVEDARTLQSPGYSPLAKTIKTMRQIKGSAGIQFLGPAETLEKLKGILNQVDGATGPDVNIGSNVLVYKIKSTSPIDLMSQLKTLARESQRQKQKPGPFVRAIESVRYVKSSHSLVFIGSKTALSQIQKILGELDAGPMLKQDKSSTLQTQTMNKRSVDGYQIYVPQFVPGDELVQMVTNFEAHLANVGMMNNGLSEVIDHLTYVQKTNTIIVSGEKEGVLEVIALLKQFDNLETLESSGGSPDKQVETISDQGFLLYKIQNLEGNEVVNALKKISISLKAQESESKKNDGLIQAISSIQWIETTNSLIATGASPVLTKLNQLLKTIDRPISQVFIEVLVLETTVTDDITFGLGWQNKGTLYNKFGYSLGNLTPGSDSLSIPFAQNLNGIDGKTVPAGSSVPPPAGGYMGIIGDIIFHNGNSYSSIGSLLNALKTEGTTTVVLSQKIVTQDNQNAKIFSGSNVPFTGSLVTTSGLSQTTNANLEYRNIGVTLSITPNISEDGMITLDIDEEISEEDNTGDDSSNDLNTATINGIRTTKTNMTTRVRVPDRHFLILSGTMRNQITRSIAGIPCLGGLPLIGAAFSKTEKNIENRNVIIFVKPHIIESNKQYKDITQDQENLYNSKDQSNIEDFRDGLELVKAPSDADVDDDYDDFYYDD
ncbi:MAG: Type 3 secretion system secretin [Chlamydiia bacterium]|nr:Type 3 secretion system secretin [Chlamydiia bacterium]